MPATTHQSSEFKLAKGWAIATYTFFPALILVLSWLLIQPFVTEQPSILGQDNYWWLAIIFTGFILLLVYGLIECYKAKVVLASDKLYTQSVFTYRELYFNEIKGYRLLEDYIIVEPINSKKKKLKISTYLGQINFLVQWLADDYPDLDIQEQEDEYNTILEDESLGRDTTERELKLQRARKNAKILNWAGGLATAWLWFYPEPYEFAVLACLIVPIFGMLAIRFSNGLLRLDEKKNSAYPEVSWATIIPGIALAVRAVTDFDIYEYNNVWVVAAVITLTGLTAILPNNKAFKYNKPSDYLVIVGIAFVMYFYGFGSTILINCYYDSSAPEIYTTRILEKRISSGKTTTYYFEVAAPSSVFNPEEVSVTKEMYGQFQEGDFVTIYLHDGLLDIPWYYIAE